jgi:hypothetical protein
MFVSYVFHEYAYGIVNYVIVCVWVCGRICSLYHMINVHCHCIRLLDVSFQTSILCIYCCIIL